ncbi:hypothetical protein [Pseudoalteromonas sp. T1lg23B]|uniref:hypothetical protein n=1 Tax=Pseudoalteromonas sp. T1lg23B TaxID=2077097 RepID=UPI000CF65867|nr:hypothetical protein [Pseudoalteromonas sp. T1lg23B]
MQIFTYILLAITIKTSLLGLGMVSLLISLIALLFIKFIAADMPEYHTKRFARAFKVAVFAHLSAYGLLIIKLAFVDGLRDIPAFIASHLIIHHILSGAIAGGLTLYGIKIFMYAKASTLVQK